MPDRPSTARREVPLAERECVKQGRPCHDHCSHIYEDESSAAQGQREPQYVYAESREEAQRLLDNSYLKKYRAVPASPFHERFWWLPVATVAAGCLALTGVLVWLSYFGALSHG